MEILWLAIVLYSIGLGLVLHFKPAVMFNENGTWKEFGYQRSSSSRHTIFPFWLFAVSWAFVSYAVAAAITWVFPSDGMLGVASAVAAANTFGYTQAEYSDSETEDIPVSQIEEPKRGRGRPRKERPRPGYYVVDPESKEGGLRKYIYYGEKAPED